MSQCSPKYAPIKTAPMQTSMRACMLRSMRWMLEAADISTGGIRGAVAVKLTAAVYLSTMRVWRRDDSPDFARTMAALDARLRRIERCLIPTHQPRGDEELASA